MPEALVFLGNFLFILVQPAAVFASALTLPGSLIVLASAATYSFATGWQRPTWPVLVALLVMSLVAELLDNMLSMFGVRKYGGSRRTAMVAGLGALGGAILGGIIFGGLGLAALLAGPVGWVIGVLGPPLLGAFAGGFGAAYWMETRAGRERDEAIRAGYGAIFGRVLGVVAKVAITTAMAAVTLVSVYWRH